MEAHIASQSYGKSKVRLTKVVPSGAAQDWHDVYEFAVDILLYGDFEASYTDGDNSKVVATDSQKNTVYVLACESEFDSPEAFALILANHFVGTYEQVSGAQVNIHQSLLNRIDVDGQPHPHAFTGGTSEKRYACCDISEQGASLTGGIVGLQVLKSAGSAFVDFVEDRYRTLADTRKRIFATSIDAKWSFADGDSAEQANSSHDAVRKALVKTFAEHYSLAVQQTLYEMGGAALEATEAINRIDLSMPNQHRVPFDLTPFGLENKAEIFVTTDEPAGQINGSIVRKKPTE
ncbi:MAG: factor-independent urate hydroxylase [Pseudomonadota bacterium]